MIRIIADVVDILDMRSQSTPSGRKIDQVYDVMNIDVLNRAISDAHEKSKEMARRQAQPGD